MIKRVLQEPLLHFAVAGSLVFAYLSANEPAVNPQIVISAGKIKQIKTQFSRTRQRAPTKEELKALIDSQVRVDLAFQQGVQMGLVENDAIIKRRVQQKLEFMLDDVIANQEPDKEALLSFLNQHQEDYTTGPVFTFKHIYIDLDKHDDLDAYLSELQSSDLDEVYRESGDSLMLGNEFQEIPAEQLERLFGERFVTEMDQLKLHQWLGPVQSGYGMHLVFLDDKIPGHTATIDEVESKLRRDYRKAEQDKATDTFYAELLKNYDLVIENDTQ